MSKGEVTREHIIAEAAVLFNSRGFSGTPLSELMKRTGLKKGGIYNHFANKEEILIAAFDYSMALLLERVGEVLAREPTATGKLKSLLEFYRHYPMNPVIGGGCPLLNAMVDSDNTNAKFRAHVQEAIDTLIRRLAAVITAGIRNGEFRKRLDGRATASMMLASIEGGVALSRNYENNEHMGIVIDYLNGYIDAAMVP